MCLKGLKGKIKTYFFVVNDGPKSIRKCKKKFFFFWKILRR